MLVLASSATDAVCYDRAIVGHIRHAENFVDLNDFFPGQLMLGGRFDVDIGVDQVLAGSRKPTTIKARVVLTHMIRPRVQLLILLRRGPVEAGKENAVQMWGGGFIPRASSQFPWRVVVVRRWSGRFDPSDPSLPPRCS